MKWNITAILEILTEEWIKTEILQQYYKNNGNTTRGEWIKIEILLQCHKNTGNTSVQWVDRNTITLPQEYWKH